MHNNNSKFHFKNIKTARLAELIAKEGMPPIEGQQDSRRKKKMKRLDRAIKSKDINQLLELEDEL